MQLMGRRQNSDQKSTHLYIYCFSDATLLYWNAYMWDGGEIFGWLDREYTYTLWIATGWTSSVNYKNDVNLSINNYIKYRHALYKISDKHALLKIF